MLLGSVAYLGGTTFLGDEEVAGSWGQLWAIIKEPVEQPPEDYCPNDGVPYSTGPDGQRFCRFDGFQPGGEGPT